MFCIPELKLFKGPNGPGPVDEGLRNGFENDGGEKFGDGVGNDGVTGELAGFGGNVRLFGGGLVIVAGGLGGNVKLFGGGLVAAGGGVGLGAGGTGVIDGAGGVGLVFGGDF